MMPVRVDLHHANTTSQTTKDTAPQAARRCSLRELRQYLAGQLRALLSSIFNQIADRRQVSPEMMEPFNVLLPVDGFKRIDKVVGKFLRLPGLKRKAPS